MREAREDITGVILAGGKSSRMGIEKALLKINGITLIERVISFCKLFFNKVLISTNESELYRFTGVDCIKDIHPNLGPISGIHAGLSVSITEKIFVLSVDTIFDEPKLIQTLLESNANKLISLPVVEGIPQYVFGIYSKALLPKIDEMILENNKPTPRMLTHEVETELIDFEKLDFFNTNKFININSPEDFERAKSCIVTS